MNLQKIWLIAKREYTYNFRRRSFLFTAFGIPLFTIGIMVIVMGAVTNSIEDIGRYKQVGVVDQANILVDQANKPVIDFPKPFVLMTSTQEADTALQAKTIDGYYVVPPDFMSNAHLDSYNRPELSLNEGLDARAIDVVKRALAAHVGSTDLAARLQNPLNKLDIYRLGNPQPLQESALLAVFFLPMIFGMLIFISITTTSQFLMSGMAEEKENRMMEMFITSARPLEMLWGKILGLGALGLTQMIVWAVIGLGFASSQGTLNLGQTLTDLQITPGTLISLFVYFILGYLMFGAIMAGVGAMVSAEQEGRQLTGMLSLFGILPIALIVTYINDPNGPIPTIMSMFPLTSPVGMILRMSWTNVSTAEILLSMAILAVSVFGMIWLAARIFRLGMLSYGRRLGIRDIVQAFREGRRSIVTVAEVRR